MSEVDDSISVIVIGIIGAIILVVIIGHLPNYMQYILFPILGIISIFVIGKFNSGGHWPSDITKINTSEESREITQAGNVIVSGSDVRAVSNSTLESPESIRLAAEIARKQAQVSWAIEKLIGEANKVVVVPVFKYNNHSKQWQATEDIIRQGNNKAFASLLLMAYTTSNSNWEHWQDKQWGLVTNNSVQFLISALALMPVEDAEKYKAGMLLQGRIDTVYTIKPPNPKNLKQDRWFICMTALVVGIPCKDEAGNVWYQKRYFEDDLDYPVQPLPKIGNLKEIQEITKGNKDCEDAITFLGF